MGENNTPIKKFRAGAISASIFKNNGKRKNGEDVEFNTIQLQRAYKDKNDEWQNTSTLRVNDLPRAALLLGKAYEHLVLKNVNTEAAVEDIEEQIPA